MITKVVNCKTERFDVFIGRPSKWGNPFKIGQDGTREDVLTRYKDWLLNNEDLILDLKELRGKTLGCYCKPEDCHGDVIIETMKMYRIIE